MDSKNWLSRNAGDVGKMYLNHIREVVAFIAGQARGLQVLLWDDMLRKVSVAAIQGECGAQVPSFTQSLWPLPSKGVGGLCGDRLGCSDVTEGQGKTRDLLPAELP